MIHKNDGYDSVIFMAAMVIDDDSYWFHDFSDKAMGPMGLPPIPGGRSGGDWSARSAAWGEFQASNLWPFHLGYRRNMENTWINYIYIHHNFFIPRKLWRIRFSPWIDWTMVKPWNIYAFEENAY